MKHKKSLEVWYYRDLDLIVLKEDFMGMVTLKTVLGEGVYLPHEKQPEGWEHKHLVYIGEFEK